MANGRQEGVDDCNLDCSSKTRLIVHRPCPSIPTVVGDAQNLARISELGLEFETKDLPP